MSRHRPVGHIEMRQVTDATEIGRAKLLEQSIFRQCGFSDLSDYDVYDPQSFFFGAFEPGGECVGMLRLVHAQPRLCPALEHMSVDRVEQWKTLATGAQLDEVATVAVQPSHRDGQLFLDLVRLAYRSARTRGVTHFIIIIEPDRAKKINEAYEFLYRRVGPDQNYREETHTTAPFVLDLDRQDVHLAGLFPLYLQWFRDTPFDSSEASPLSRQRGAHTSAPA